MAEKTALDKLKEWNGYKPYPSAYGVEKTLAELRDKTVDAIEAIVPEVPSDLECDTVTATGAITGATVTATGVVEGASLKLGNVTLSDTQLTALLALLENA